MPQSENVYHFYNSIRGERRCPGGYRYLEAAGVGPDNGLYQAKTTLNAFEQFHARIKEARQRAAEQQKMEEQERAARAAAELRKHQHQK